MNPEIDSDGTKKWYNKKGLLHRKDGPAIEYSNGTKSWFLNGKCHREDGPAIEWNDGTKSWYLNGLRHREDGPAIEWATGTYWYLNDKEITEELHHKLTQGSIKDLPKYLGLGCDEYISERLKDES